jgi:hypothetical protein
MKLSNDWRKRQIACGLAILLSLPLSEAYAAPLQPIFQTQDPQSTSTARDLPQGADDATGKSAAGTNDPSKKNSEELPTAPSSMPVQKSDSPSALPNSEALQNSTTAPVGTAAAPYEKPVGAAVARPAGAAIAPAKQRRSRSLKIRIAIVVGTAVAVGTVVALSMASPSKAH